MKKLKRLVLAAHASELKPFASLGRGYLKIENDTAYLAAGVGPVAASFGLTHFLEDYRPARIIVIGTAGTIDERKFKIGEIAIASQITTVSKFAECYTPKIQPARIILPDAKTISGCRKARVYCPQEITRSPEWRASLLAAKHDVEHLEAFAFAFVARKFRIPINIILGIANVVGPEAHEQWLKNARAALDAAACLVSRI